MAKEKEDTTKPDKKDRKERKHKKKEEKLSDTNGVSKKSKSDKKERKHKKAVALPAEVADKFLQDIEDKKDNIAILPHEHPEPNGDVKIDVEMSGTREGDEDKKELVLQLKPIGALVPFANPLADEKVAKKVFKSVKKGNPPSLSLSTFHPQHSPSPKLHSRLPRTLFTDSSGVFVYTAAKAKSLKRGVKEVVKALRKSPMATNKSSTETPLGIVVLAADISPMDVISHLPVLCEDHGIPYVYVTSRAELGAASSTKRPTSVVMVGREKGKGKVGGKKIKEEGEGGGEEKKEEDWGEVYADLVKVVRRAGRDVRI
ncbi:snoRNA-binding protein [Thelotrema lepadinum]|nr:snoRNA-binding protein [Thelotrema lepadinum]